MKQIYEFFFQMGLPKRDLFLLNFYLFTLAASILLYIESHTIEPLLNELLKKRRIIKKYNITVK